MTVHPRGPEECKAAAKALGLPRGDQVLALARNNDPFFAGTAAHWRDANWFARHWQAAGYTSAHLRRFHYRLFSLQKSLPGGAPYLNNGACWSTLTMAGKMARYLGTVPVDAITDARNAPAIRNVRPEDYDREPWAEPRASRLNPDATRPPWWLPRITGQPLIEPATAMELPEFVVGGYEYDDATEPVLLSCWCENPRWTTSWCRCAGSWPSTTSAGPGLSRSPQS